MGSKLFGLQRRRRGQKIHNFSVFTCIDKDKRGHFPKAGVHIHLCGGKCAFQLTQQERRGTRQQKGIERGSTKKLLTCLDSATDGDSLGIGIRKILVIVWPLLLETLKSLYVGIHWLGKREEISRSEYSASLGFYLICVFKKWVS